MFKKLKIEKRYITYGILVLVFGLLLLIGYKVINNSGNILMSLEAIFRNFFIIIAPIFYGFILSYLLFRPVLYVQRLFIKLYERASEKKASESIESAFRILSIVIVLAIIIGTIILIINFVLPPIIENIKVLLGKLPQYKEQINLWLQEVATQLNENNIEVQSTGQVADKIVNKVSFLSDKFLSFIAKGIIDLSSFVLNSVLTAIFTFYFLKDKESLFGNFRRIRDVLMPGKVGRAVTIFFRDLDEVVGKFLIAEIFDCIIVGIVSTILLVIIKHPFAILIGFMAGVTNIIPFVGPVIGAALAFGLGVFTSFGLGVAGAILLLLYQQVDGNFIQPKIVGDKIGLSPIWILIVVLIGGNYFGAMGMILSMPIAGLIKIYFNRYAAHKRVVNDNKL
ncbi:Predicted PurR-regulated permease PerM [Clostridium collagenovorans DSM 3089]|uniref:Predicted PurR-regulated permease PerM n=1 Tax=Clostridium collagenovorans DSM 3089 TaxID=1121306 RepID=A0A1M5WRE0_9CLOT|nr:AI-2E family transporter [Clostridium collagenovorans]SHH90195.1 Predicted PurR-regulated permease PerM [Clostridium collagenovorans DSM 3089]